MLMLCACTLAMDERWCACSAAPSATEPAPCWCSSSAASSAARDAEPTRRPSPICPSQLPGPTMSVVMDATLLALVTTPSAADARPPLLCALLACADSCI